ncbi:Protein of unknown function [Pyronema omphalodes CBS 100304]|uniref:Uncharacterized protein n=1 Tax=Pyronema omphalodes (strain CBS 100304) TaxID=1076935 RepID=U4LGX9_PYROM|nr:Protein of unknown function [Pyronema omphalodes CBS 100304]
MKNPNPTKPFLYIISAGGRQ